jgi:hypothetical protein
MICRRTVREKWGRVSLRTMWANSVGGMVCRCNERNEGAEWQYLGRGLGGYSMNVGVPNTSMMRGGELSWTP